MDNLKNKAVITKEKSSKLILENIKSLKNNNEIEGIQKTKSLQIIIRRVSNRNRILLVEFQKIFQIF